MYDFGELVDRHGTGCAKYDSLPSGIRRKDIIPLWIADMDFKTPDFIVDALRKRIEHPVFGYPVVPDDYFITISEWVSTLHGWSVDPHHIRYIPGIVKGIGLALNTFLSPGDKVIIQPPVYHPFRIVSEKNGFDVLRNPLIPVYEDGCPVDYRMDFDGLEKLIDAGAKAIILANPHNPAGICWSRETLERLAEMTAAHGVLVISDEIHGEMAHKGHKHIPYASVSRAAASNSITFMAPSKTFNIAGIVSSYTIVLSEALRSRFFGFLDANELDSPAIFPIEATMAAYKNGALWRKEMLDYVEGNIDFVMSYLSDNIPNIKALRPQASFLIWLDCRGLGLGHDELQQLFIEKAGEYLNDGSMFGEEGQGFMRLNVGCPRSMLALALERLKDALF